MLASLIASVSNPAPGDNPDPEEKSLIFTAMRGREPMISIEFHAKVARDVTDNCASRAIAVETIELAAQDVQYADASRTDQQEFWKVLKADIAALRRSIPQRHVPAPVNAILNAALEEILRQEAKLDRNSE